MTWTDKTAASAAGMALVRNGNGSADWMFGVTVIGGRDRAGGAVEVIKDSFGGPAFRKGDSAALSGDAVRWNHGYLPELFLLAFRFGGGPCPLASAPAERNTQLMGRFTRARHRWTRPSRRYAIRLGAPLLLACAATATVGATAASSIPTAPSRPAAHHQAAAAAKAKATATATATVRPQLFGKYPIKTNTWIVGLGQNETLGHIGFHIVVNCDEDCGGPPADFCAFPGSAVTHQPTGHYDVFRQDQPQGPSVQGGEVKLSDAPDSPPQIPRGSSWSDAITLNVPAGSYFVKVKFYPNGCGDYLYPSENDGNGQHLIVDKGQPQVWLSASPQSVLPPGSTTLVADLGNYPGPLPAPDNGVYFQQMDGDTVVTAYYSSVTQDSGTGDVSARMPVPLTKPGTYTYRAIYTGDENYFNATSGFPVTVTVAPLVTTTTLASDDNPAVLDDEVNLTAAVTTGDSKRDGALAGTVRFVDTAVSPARSLGSATVSGGVATLRLTGTELGLGTSQIHACYYPDDSSNSCTAGSLAQVVAKNPTTTTLRADRTGAPVGQAVTFTAVVDSGDEVQSGPVTFYLDGTPAFTVDHVDPSRAPVTAVWTTSTLGAGQHTVTASFGGDDTHAASDSSAKPLKVTVTRRATQIALAADHTQVRDGGAVAFTATVRLPRTVEAAIATPDAGAVTTDPSGTVTFLVDGRVARTVALSGGTARWSTTGLVAGTHAVTARFDRNDTFDTSTSARLTVVVATRPPVGRGSVPVSSPGASTGPAGPAPTRASSGSLSSTGVEVVALLGGSLALLAAGGSLLLAVRRRGAAAHRG